MTNICAKARHSERNYFFNTEKNHSLAESFKIYLLRNERLLNFSLKAPIWPTGNSFEEWNETTLQTRIKKFEEKRLEDRCLAGGHF